MGAPSGPRAALTATRSDRATPTAREI